MRNWEAYLCTALQTLLFVSTLAQIERSCPADESRRNGLTISFHRRLNDSDGQWMTTFSAHAKDEADSPAGLRMDATHTAVECSGIRDINVEITVRGTWIYHKKNVSGGNKIIVENYGTDTCGIQVGETIGVMKRANGSLHFVYNGIDQGPAITNAPSVVYGVYEVRGFSLIATIVNRK